MSQNIKKKSISADKMGSTPMLRLILSMSLPTMFSMIIQAMYNIVDSVFVSSLGQDALTALSLAYPLQLMTISVAVGTGVGINSFISRRLGEKNHVARCLKNLFNGYFHHNAHGEYKNN